MLTLNKQHHIFTRVALAVVCTAALATPISALAAPAATTQRSGGITISPPLKELSISSGLITANTSVTLTNKTGKDLSASIRVVDFQSQNEFGGVALGQVGAPTSTYGLANWMTLPSGKNVALPNNVPTTIPVLIDNRADLAPGGHYGAVVVTASAADTAAGNKVNFKQELVSLLFVKKLGGEKYGLDLQSFTAGKGTGVPDNVSLKFRSTGNVHVVPRGYVEARDPSGKLVAKGIIDPESTLVLPGTSRQFITLLQPVAPSTMSGRYKITAYYRHDGEAEFTTKIIYVHRGHFSPLLKVGAAVAVLIIVLLLVVLRKRSTKIYKTRTILRK